MALSLRLANEGRESRLSPRRQAKLKRLLLKAPQATFSQSK